MVDRTALYPKTDARVLNLCIKAGDAVNEGDVLLTYADDTLDTYKNQIADLNLQLSAARLRVAELSVPPGEMDVLAAERAVDASENDISELLRKMEQFDTAIALLEDEKAKAEIKRQDAFILYDAGVIPKNEYDAFADAILKIENEIKARKADKEALDSTMEALESARDFNVKKYEAVLNRPNDEAVQSQINQGNISIKQIELKIEQLQKQIDSFVYEEIAAVSGTVLTLNVKEGGFASRSVPFAEIADTGYENLKITLNVPETEAAEVRLGQEAEITGNILGKDTVAGVVDRIQPIAEQKQISGSLETVIGIELSFDDKTGRLRSGNTVNADIIVHVYEDITVIPLMATFSDTDGLEYVYVVNDDYTVSKREVTLLAFSDLNVGVTGLDKGETIVASPTSAITDGAYIRPVVRNNGE
jgi:multidrug efflux pump subunit AcrA (membrane-fusion protein)